MTLAPTLFVSPPHALAALPIPSGSRIGVLLGVLVAVVAVRLAKVRAHCQPFVKDAASRIKQFLQRGYLFRPLPDRIGLEAGQLGQMRDGVGDAIHCDVPGIAPVSLLGLHASPAAVAGLVIAFVVDPVKGEAVRTRPHVLRKGGEAFAPTVTDLYPASAVVPALPVVRVIAATAHIAPNTVQRMFVLEGHNDIMPTAI